MADLQVQIGTRNYRVACENGQEAHLQSVAARLRQEADALTAQFGSLSETRLLLMAGLLVADRLRALESRAAESTGLSARLGEAETIAERLRAEKAAMAAELSDAVLEQERLRATLEKARAEIERLRETADAPADPAETRRLAALERENARLKAALERGDDGSAEAENAALRDRIAAAEHRNALLSDQIEVSERKAAAAEAAAETARAQMMQAEIRADEAELLTQEAEARATDALAEAEEAARAAMAATTDAAEDAPEDRAEQHAARALEEATRRIRVLIGDIEERAAG